MKRKYYNKNDFLFKKNSNYLLDKFFYNIILLKLKFAINFFSKD